MTYKEKLLDPRWQKKRLKIMERDNFKCVECGNDKDTLHVHHTKYKGNPWDADDKFLETLCETCHRQEHAFNNRYDDSGNVKYTDASKDYPPIYLNKHVTQGKSFSVKEVLAFDYKDTFPGVPYSVYHLLVNLLDYRGMTDEQFSGLGFSFTRESYIRTHESSLNDNCLRNNIKIVSEVEVFGLGDETKLKNIQYFDF